MGRLRRGGFHPIAGLSYGDRNKLLNISHGNRHFESNPTIFDLYRQSQSVLFWQAGNTPPDLIWMGRNAIPLNLQSQRFRLFFLVRQCKQRAPAAAHSNDPSDLLLQAFSHHAKFRRDRK